VLGRYWGRLTDIEGVARVVDKLTGVGEVLAVAVVVEKRVDRRMNLKVEEWQMSLMAEKEKILSEVEEVVDSSSLVVVVEGAVTVVGVEKAKSVGWVQVVVVVVAVVAVAVADVVGQPAVVDMKLVVVHQKRVVAEWSDQDMTDCVQERLNIVGTGTIPVSEGGTLPFRSKTPNVVGRLGESRIVVGGIVVVVAGIVDEQG
jgi:hypothetical protein